MNNLETKMVEILSDLKDKYGAVSIKADFIAEGMRVEEILRLKEICMVAGLGLTLKIGGCESIRDMIESKIIGIDGIIAPMVESPYALRKYLQGINKFFTPEEISEMEVLCNIESITACNHIEEMLEIPEISLLNGIVIKRVDLCYSLGMDDESINNEEINNVVQKTLKKAKNKKENITCGVGGGVSAQSLQFFETLASNLDTYETRKICFSYPQSRKNNPEKGIMKALEFEYFWLKNKIEYFQRVLVEDKWRMDLIEHKYLDTIQSFL